jgi:hypothetical protein
MHKSAKVIEAAAALDAKAAELQSARELVERLKAEHEAASQALRQACAEEDSLLPQCRLFRIRWHSGKAADEGRSMVIVRRTPGGMLVVRYAGQPRGEEQRFKWSKHAQYFMQVEKRGFTGDYAVLRDIPPEYIPLG